MSEGEKAVADVEFGEVGPSVAEGQEQAGERNLEMLYDIPLRVTARLGEAQVTLKELLGLAPGAVVKLDRMAGQSIELLVNGVVVGKGEVVVVNDHFGVRITEIESPGERLKSI